jgi:Holliday junction resolvase RusA-like endonuclease
VGEAVTIDSITFLVEGINPEPWAISTGNKKVFSPESLRSYKKAMFELSRDALLTRGHMLPIFPQGASVQLSLAFWRQLDSASVGGGKTVHRNRADATNLLKATEDALQGVLYANDRDNLDVQSTIIDVGPEVEPAILITACIAEVDAMTAAHRAVREYLIQKNKTDSTRTIYFT